MASLFLLKVNELSNAIDEKVRSFSSSPSPKVLHHRFSSDLQAKLEARRSLLTLRSDLETLRAMLSSGQLYPALVRILM